MSPEHLRGAQIFGPASLEHIFYIFFSEQIQNHIKPSQSPSSDISASQSLKIEGDSNDAISISSNEEDKDVSSAQKPTH